MKPLIEFKKQRELGDILSDTFKFIRQEFKPFLKTIFVIAGPYLVLLLVAMAIYLYVVGDMFNINDLSDGALSLGILFLALAIFLISMVLAYTFANAAALHYIRSYIENNGKVNINEIKHDANQSFWRFIGLGITKWLVLIFATMLCFLPVIYFMVPMALVFSIMVFEKKDVSDSFSYSFTLIKGEYWMTLVTIIVVGIIVVISSYAFQLPATIYSFIKMGTLVNEIDIVDSYNFLDPIDVFLNLLGTFFQFLLNLISIVAYAFIYFHLNEKKNFTGTYEKISALGKSQD